VPLAAKINDSLRVLPLVRKETRSLRKAVAGYRSAADSAHASYLAQVQASINTQLALREQKIETTRARVDAKEWKGKAQRRGWLNWLLALGAAVGAGFAATR
jgi:hypothetical protein